MRAGLSPMVKRYKVMRLTGGVLAQNLSYEEACSLSRACAVATGDSLEIYEMTKDECTAP